MYEEILSLLPYKNSFRFVDEITHLNENGVVGNYTLKEDEFFYQDHFEGNPITPGVILIEILAQIGLVVLGIYLLKNKSADIKENSFPMFASSNVNFFRMVKPGEKVTVSSEKLFFRFGKLKCNVKMTNELGETIVEGELSGFVKEV